MDNVQKHNICTSVPLSHKRLDLIGIKLIYLLCNQPSAESPMRSPLRDVIFAAWSVLLVVITGIEERWNND
jgi:hypothetical protein